MLSESRELAYATLRCQSRLDHGVGNVRNSQGKLHNRLNGKSDARERRSQRQRPVELALAQYTTLYCTSTDIVSMFNDRLALGGFMSEDLDRLKEWTGKKEVHHDVVSAWPVQAMTATLDRTERVADLRRRHSTGLALVLFPRDAKPASELGSDGHPKRGGFLPPVPLPRRMWAGGQMGPRRPLPDGGSVAERIGNSIGAAQDRAYWQYGVRYRAPFDLWFG